MNNNSSELGACLAVTLALLTGIPACGDLDETDADPPSVNALASWDSSHLVAVRTYHKEPVILDLQSGKQTGTLTSSKYYEDIAMIGGGEFICLQNQSIDFFRADWTLDESRSIVATQITGMAVSIDHSTLAYALAVSPTENNIRIADLPTGTQRAPAPDVSFNLGLSISRDGNLVAFAQGDVGVVITHAPGTTSTCVLQYDARHPGGPLATAFSPAEDKLAVGKDDGGVNIFDLGHFPDCTLASSYVSPEDIAPRVAHLEYSPDGTVLAISVEQTASSATGDPVATTGVVRLLDAATATLVRELPVYQWQKTSDPSNDSPAISDLQWSETGDSLTVSTSNGPVQQWDVATGNLLWSASL